MVYIRADRSVYTTGDALLKFLFKSTSISTFSGLRLALCLSTISPLVEKILSAGTEVAVMQSSRLTLYLLKQTASGSRKACTKY